MGNASTFTGVSTKQNKKRHEKLWKNGLNPGNRTAMITYMYYPRCSLRSHPLPTSLFHAPIFSVSSRPCPSHFICSVWWFCLRLHLGAAEHVMACDCPFPVVTLTLNPTTQYHRRHRTNHTTRTGTESFVLARKGLAR